MASKRIRVPVRVTVTPRRTPQRITIKRTITVRVKPKR
jgi:hypothetical protein